MAEEWNFEIHYFFRYIEYRGFKSPHFVEKTINEIFDECSLVAVVFKEVFEELKLCVCTVVG